MSPDVLSRSEVARIDRVAIARWRTNPRTSIGAIVRELAFALRRVRGSDRPELLPPDQQAAYFAILAVVAERRATWAGALQPHLRSPLSRLRDLHAR